MTRLCWYFDGTMPEARTHENGAVTIPGPCTVIWESALPYAEVGGAEPDPSVVHQVVGAVAKLVHTLFSRPRGPLMDRVAGFALHGHFVGAYGCLVCGFPVLDAAAAFRAYARGLGLLTDGRVRLVPADWFPREPLSGRVLLEGPVDTPQQVQALLIEFRAMLPRLVTAKQVMYHQLLFAELAANTLRYGRQGRMAVYEEGGRLSVLATDQGPGIPFHLLPGSLLLTGYTSTPGSLGAGLPTIVRLAETVTLTTGDQGTSILVRLRPTSAEGS